MALCGSGLSVRRRSPVLYKPTCSLPRLSIWRGGRLTTCPSSEERGARAPRKIGFAALAARLASHSTCQRRTQVGGALGARKVRRRIPESCSRYRRRRGLGRIHLIGTHSQAHHSTDSHRAAGRLPGSLHGKRAAPIARPGRMGRLNKLIHAQFFHENMRRRTKPLRQCLRSVRGKNNKGLHDPPMAPPTSSSSSKAPC